MPAIVSRLPGNLGDTSKTRIFYSNGRIEHYDSPQLAMSVWYGLPPEIGAAVRDAGDMTPVYPHDYVYAV